jgi:hypothetical protein
LPSSAQPHPRFHAVRSASGPSWSGRRGLRVLIDPKVLSVAMQAGRALGWQRLIPLALLGFLAAQWVQEARREDTPRSG